MPKHQPFVALPYYRLQKCVDFGRSRGLQNPQVQTFIQWVQRIHFGVAHGSRGQAADYMNSLLEATAVYLRVGERMCEMIQSLQWFAVS